MVRAFFRDLYVIQIEVYWCLGSMRLYSYVKLYSNKLYLLNAAFGQSSSSPFGSQSVFGQTSSVGTNPFAPKPFGSPTTPFGSQTGSSLFGGTSTGVFGQPSTPTFGASSAPAFGSSVPAFGSSTTPSFGGSSSSFGGKFLSVTSNTYLAFSIQKMVA